MGERTQNHSGGPFLVFVAVVSAAIAAESRADDFAVFLKPLLAERCVKCHGGKAVNGDVNFKAISSQQHLVQHPSLIKRMLDVIDRNGMPPEDEPQLDDKTRTKLVSTLKSLLRQAASGTAKKPVQIRRLNRFQYNNTVNDLFQLKLDVLRLPEKLMVRQDRYLHEKRTRMPDKVQVQPGALNTLPSLRNVRAFPKDLRASHGFNNQADHLTLSPLLFDAFLRLSVSIVESPDFNEGNVGIWNEFFREPQGAGDKSAEVRRRLDRFLKFAFRGPVSAETLDRYTAYVVSRRKAGLSFTDSMKKAASAVLSSPMFLFRSPAANAKDSQYELASNLSYCLWGSCPDRELLRLADRGELASPAILRKTIDRMLADPKIERFLDSFPTQWMQLENALAVTPDPQKNRYFSLEKDRPASLQMVLEPLLLFDAAFVENRPVVELIAPRFSYRSQFLNTWYTSKLQPPRVDVARIETVNRRNDQRRQRLLAQINEIQLELDGLIKPVRARLLAARRKGDSGKAIDLKPYAAWEFNGNLKDSVKSLDLKPHGKIAFHDGAVVLNRAYLLSKPLSIDLKAKSLEVWCKVPDLNQRGGGVMGIQGPGDFFDTIVLGERKPRHWISGSNGFSRTKDFPGSTPETGSNRMLHLVMVYQSDGTTRLYRDGKPYGKSYRKGAATFPKGRSAVIFGLRHLPPGGNKFLAVSLDKARLYDRALTAEEVAASSAGSAYVSDADVVKSLTPEQKQNRSALLAALGKLRGELKTIPGRRDPRKLQQEIQRKFDDELRSKMRSYAFERVAISDPRYGGVITNAAVLSMTSGPKRTHPIARGAWIIEAIFNDPPAPPPNDVPPLNEDSSDKRLTIREKFAVHRKNPSCAGCHSRLDPLGFALENYDITGRWRETYENGRQVDASGTMMRKYKFAGVVGFKAALVKEKRRFARAFAGHLLRFAASRELTPADSLTLDEIVHKTEQDDFRLKALIGEVVTRAVQSKRWQRE